MDSNELPKCPASQERASGPQGTRIPGDDTFLTTASESVIWIYEYWASRRHGHAMPRRCDIDPMDFPKHLPGILLLDVEYFGTDGNARYRYRVVGTKEVRNRGHDPTGKYVEEGYFGPSLEDALEAYDLVRRGRTFLYNPIAFKNNRGAWIDELSILLPLSEDAENVTQVLVYSEQRSNSVQRKPAI